MAIDPHKNSQRIQTVASSRKAFTISPDDDNDLAAVTQTIYVGTGGNIAVIFEGDDSAVTLIAANDGQILPYAVRRVLSTNTTASNLVGTY